MEVTMVKAVLEMGGYRAKLANMIIAGFGER